MPDTEYLTVMSAVNGNLGESYSSRGTHFMFKLPFYDDRAGLGTYLGQ